MTIASELQERLRAAGQEHVVERLAALDGEGRARLAAELVTIDLALVQELAGLVAEGPAAGGQAAGPRLEPPELFPLARSGATARRAEAARAAGRRLLSSARVGFVLVAGGQASRLGYDAPKGVFPIGPVTGRSLFAFHAQRLRRAAQVYGVAVPWYVMTSPANHAATVGFFEEHDFFGLNPDDVFFFSQDMLPALDERGRMLFAGRDALFRAPNGHGGCLIGLAQSGALEDMRARGLQQLSYFQVDNPLVRPADPLFLGLHAEAGAGMSTKVVSKRDAGEKVGVIGRIDGRMGCIEYSDLTDELREARDEAGELRFRAGNIAVHALSVDFLEHTVGSGLRLPWHVARKTMSVVDAQGAVAEVSGFKFETFVFDALARSTASVTLEVDRAEEFSPVKNREGEDSPASARRDLCQLFARWVRAAGGTLPVLDAEGLAPIEIDPLFAETEEEFLAHGHPAPSVQPSGHLYR